MHSTTEKYVLRLLIKKDDETISERSPPPKYPTMPANVFIIYER